MKNILLNNGKLVPIMSIDDVLEVIEENLGNELAIYLKSEITFSSVLESEIEDNHREIEELNDEIDRLNSDRMEAWRKVSELKDELEEEKDRTRKAMHGKLKNDVEPDELPFC